jgi:hypothetical protein
MNDLRLNSGQKKTPFDLQPFSVSGFKIMTRNEQIFYLKKYILKRARSSEVTGRITAKSANRNCKESIG